MSRAEWRRLQAATASAAAPQTVDAGAEAPVVDQIAAASATIAVAALAVTESAAEAEVTIESPAPALPLRRRLRAAATPVELVFTEAEESAAVVAPEAEADVAPEPVIFVASEPEAIATEAISTDATEPAVAGEEAHDPFEYAARLFSFTGETPIQRSEPAASQPPTAGPAHVVTRRRGGRIVQRVAAASFSMGVMTIVGLLAIGTTTPASAVAAVSNPSTDLTAPAVNLAAAGGEIQAYVSSSLTHGEALDRPEGYAVASMADIAADSGVTQFSGAWVNNPSGAVQWPFPVGVPISAAYGSSTYLAQFSSPHRGVDLTPGTGAEVHVIADGAVRIATEAGGDYGVTVVVDHVIDGQPVSTRYAHMQYRSLRVSPGDTVKVGDVLGLVGQTGKATGPHLHFEVLLGGTTHTDPIAWMYAHTQ